MLSWDIPCSPTPVLPTPVLPTLDKKVVFRLLAKTVLCNVLNINELQYNNNTTLLQYLDISVCSRYSLYISGGFKGGFKFPISASGFQGSLRRACSSFWLYNEQFSCCLLYLYCTNTSLTCTGRYTQLLQLLVQTKPVIA